MDFRSVVLLFIWTAFAHAHLAAWHPGMYCINGNTGGSDLNSYAIVTPLYQLSRNDWWFHHINNCDNFPPPAGAFLELPAGGDFTVEIASNRAKTTLSYNGRDTTDWPDGADHPDDYNVPSCITSPNMHTQNQSMAAGTAFAISYQSDIKSVTPDNLVVFSVRYHTPWKRVTSYSVPAAMPACPADGCTCAWGWVPNGCGQPNIYHQPFKCKVTGASSTTPVATPKPPVWCEDDPSKCVKGAKQMIYWNQQEGNNIQVDGYDLSGEFRSPAYNAKCGFPDGAQNDIFGGASNSDSSPASPSPSTSPSSSGSGTNSPQSNGGYTPPQDPPKPASNAPPQDPPKPASDTSGGNQSPPSPPPSPSTAALPAADPAASPKPACKPRSANKRRSSESKRYHRYHHRENRSW